MANTASGAVNNDSDGSADGGGLAAAVIDGRVDGFTTGALAATACAVYSVLKDDGEVDEFMERLFPVDVVVAAAELIRKIGERATLPVIAQELVLRKLRQTNELNMLQELALKTFAGTLRHLDAYGRTLLDMAMKAEAERNRPAPHHTPVEDTLLATGKGPLDTVI